MQVPVGGKDRAWVLQDLALPLNTGYDAAGLLHKQQAGGHIPRAGMQLPIAVKPAGGHVGRIE